MSDIFVSVVPMAIHLARPAEMARTVVEWLVEREVIVAVQSDCVLGGPLGYPPGPRYKDILESGRSYRYYEKSCQSFKTSLTKGLEVISRRTVFHAGSNGLSVILCTCCRADIINSECWTS
jgi:hypothetical protein